VKVPVTINDLLDGHVGLDVECLDRIYLNAYVPNLQVSGQVANFLTRHLGYPTASPAIFEKIGTRFRDAVRRFADERQVPVIRFRKGDRKIDVMRPLLAKAAKTGRSQVVAVGVAQEFQRVFTGANCAGAGRSCRGSRSAKPNGVRRASTSICRTRSSAAPSSRSAHTSLIRPRSG
jgi:hypothetical protein